MKIQDKVVLITGASEGIGRVTAELLAKRGARVAVAARSVDKLEEVAESLPDGMAVPVDMTKPEAISAMVDMVADRYGRIDLLINNAGQAVRAPIMEVALKDFEYIMMLNAYAPLLTMQAVVPIMKKNGGGMIVNVSSNVSKMAIPGIGAYAATKYALNGISLTARTELAPDNIIVTLMHPGLTNTRFSEHAIKTDGAMQQARGGMEGDSPLQVAEKIAEAIENEPAEQFMSQELEQRYAAPGV